MAKKWGFIYFNLLQLRRKSNGYRTEVSKPPKPVSTECPIWLPTRKQKPKKIGFRIFTQSFFIFRKMSVMDFSTNFFLSSPPPPLHPDRASLEKCDRQYGALSYILDIKDSRSYIIATRGINNRLTRAGLLVWLSSIALPRWLHCRTVYSAWNRFVLNKWKITGSDLSAVLTLTR